MHQRGTLNRMNTPRLILTSDLTGSGEDARTLAARCKRQELKRLRQGVYVHVMEWDQASAATRYGLEVAAFAHLATRPVLCFATAAMLWGLWIVGTPKVIHVLTMDKGGAGTTRMSGAGCSRRTTGPFAAVHFSSPIN